MKRAFNVILIVAIVVTVFIVGQSAYWEYTATNTEAKSFVLVDILRQDMQRNLRRIDMDLPVREDTVLINSLQDMQNKMKAQRENSILYQWFGWCVG